MITNIKYDKSMYGQYTHLHSMCVRYMPIPIFNVQFSNIIVLCINFLVIFQGDGGI